MFYDDDLSDEDEGAQFRKLLDGHFLAKDGAYRGLLRAVADEAKKGDPRIKIGG